MRKYLFPIMLVVVLAAIVNHICTSAQVTAIATDGQWQFKGIGLRTFPWAKTDLIKDKKLALATALAYRYREDWRKVADLAAQKRTPVRWGDSTENTNAYAWTIPDPNHPAIEIASDLQKASLASLAALIAHEAHHAAYHQPCLVRTCMKELIDEETAAFSWTAGVYESIPDRFKGKTELDQFNKEIVTRWHQKTLLEYVILSTGYQKQFFGEELAVR